MVSPTPSAASAASDGIDSELGLLEQRLASLLAYANGLRSANEALRRALRVEAWREGDAVLVFAAARSFLHHQVRSMVGCLKLVGEGRWSSFRRNVLEDYRLAFGEEPGRIESVGVMTDADNTQSRARAVYGDITFVAER